MKDGYVFFVALMMGLSMASAFSAGSKNNDMAELCSILASVVGFFMLFAWAI